MAYFQGRTVSFRDCIYLHFSTIRLWYEEASSQFSTWLGEAEKRKVASESLWSVNFSGSGSWGLVASVKPDVVCWLQYFFWCPKGPGWENAGWWPNCNFWYGIKSYFHGPVLRPWAKVVIGLSLANEGLSWKSARQWRVVARSFQNGIRTPTASK